ncbi:serine/threonine-protein kinase [Paractinoplanes rhizophilus]|uniref:non-specific serine/threonine protein kinase n=1 Tax=Paractinoplanes rhizophilus TaxID=1416877 RepID=A0ABW2HYK2_9ACTN
MSNRVLGGRYRLQRRLGRGGTATVWEARDTRLDRNAAVKILDASARTDPAALERLRREARSVAGLAHDNIVGVYDVDIAEDAAYLVMELVDGRSLTETIAQRGRLPVGSAVSIAAQVCDALGAAHAAGVVHRDIKPSNILVTPSGLVKVCDFGVALLDRAGGDAALTGAGNVVGTCQYMAPEQAAGDPVDGRADLYAVGCVLYAMLAGAPPFAADHPIEVLDLHLNEPPVPLRAHRDDVPPELQRLVDELLAKRPADRPRTAWSVRDRLRAVSERTPEPADPQAVAAAATRLLPEVTAVLPAARAGRGHRWAGDPKYMLLAGAAAVLAIALVFALATGGGRPPAVPAADPAAPAVSARASATATGPSPAPSPAVASPAPARATPADRLAALTVVLQQQADSGQLPRKPAKSLLRDLERVTRARDAGKAEDAAERFDKFRERVRELRAKGELDGDALPDLDGIAATLSPSFG